MMVLACIVAFPETKLRGYKIYREKRTFYIATWKVSKGINVNKKGNIHIHKKSSLSSSATYWCFQITKKEVLSKERKKRVEI